MIVPVMAEKPITMTWISRPCQLIPISPWNYRFEACEDTTGYLTLNRALALKLESSPEFDKYRQYRGWENFAQSSLGLGILLMTLDFTVTRLTGPLCRTSFSSACGDTGFTTLSWPYYLGFFSVTVPLNVFTSSKRMAYMDFLVQQFNRGLKSP